MTDKKSWAGLGDKPHKLKVHILEEKNPASTGRRITLGSLTSPKEGLPTLDAGAMKPKLLPSEGALPSVVLVELEGTDPPLRLRDFATAGEGGREYTSWLPVTGIRPQAFTSENPFRSTRPR